MTETETTDEGLRGRKKREAKEAITAAAKRLFTARGFPAVTVDEIALAANVSRRTFFRYFPTKEDVLFGRREAQLAALEIALEPAPAEAPFATVRRALISVSSLHLAEKELVLAEHAIVAKSAELLARDLEWDRKAFLLLARALARGSRGKDAARRARIAAGAIVGALRVVIEEWVESGGKRDLVGEGEEALDLLAALVSKPQ